MSMDWAILELMGHRRLAGRVTEEEVAGVNMLRIDVPRGDGFTTQYYGAAAIYCITPTTEAVARDVASMNQPQPVSPWEVARAPALPGPADDDPEY